jgi:protein KTI12
MPLVIISGYPCTGKTTFATALCGALRAADPNRNVLLINEESLHMNKLEYFSGEIFELILKFVKYISCVDAAREKLLRQNLKSAVDHVLNSETYVVLDSLNYIKGYRYELYCIARSQRTPHCVVLVECNFEITKSWNAARESDSLDMTL